MKIAAQTIRHCLLEADFSLEEKYSDAQELNHSWKDMVLPARLGAFFSVLYSVNQTKLLAETTTNCDNSTEEESEVNELPQIVITPLKKKVKLMKVPPKTKITKLKALYHIMHYNIHDG